jgi:adenine-specific DNA-methyltransferase
LPSDEWRVALSHVPEEAKTNLITRHLNNYTRKNEADFFIHKQLGKFLRGELDFFIKNEVMHLDDIDEKSTDYLTTRVRLIKALRTIAQ